MSQKRRNLISNTPQPCEARVMLAASFPEGSVVSSYGPSAADVWDNSVFGRLDLIVSGDRTYAIVPTQETGQSSGDAVKVEELLELFAETDAAAREAAQDSDSDGGERVTQDEADRIENQIFRALADRVDSAAYVGEAGSGKLWLIRRKGTLA